MNTKLNEFIESIRKEFGAGELSLTRPDLNGVYQKHGNSIGLKLFSVVFIVSLLQINPSKLLLLLPRLKWFLQ